MSTETAFLTGAASGIGAAVARRLTAEGVRVAICDVDTTRGGALAAELDGLFIECDVSDFDSMSAAVARVVAEWGAPQFVHLNAGVMTVAPDAPYLAIEEVSLAQYQRILGINLDGLFHGLKALLPVVRETTGAITLTASTAAFSRLAIDPLYATTKYAALGLMRGVAAANADHPVRINAICPGVVDTPIVPDAFRGMADLEVMSTDVMAAEVVDLLRHGASGEARVKVSAHLPAIAVEPVDIGALAAAANAAGSDDPAT
ncbi:MAG: SDR family oxidoreductase [Pseudomonadota bacterium]